MTIMLSTPATSTVSQWHSRESDFSTTDKLSERAARPPVTDCRKTSIVDKNGVAGAEPPYRSSAICATASCSGFVWLTTSILAWTRGGSPTLSPGTDAGRVCSRALQGRKANRAYTALHHGEGVWGFGKDAEIERPKALQDAKPTKRSYRDREQALFLKKHTFSTK